MKRLLIIAVSLLVTILIWSVQHIQRRQVLEDNDVLAANVAALQSRAVEAESRRQSVLQTMNGLNEQIRARETGVAQSPSRAAQPPPPPPAPDSAHQGGWPQGAGFFYFSKQYLTNVNCKLLNGDRLTDEAATLLGMSNEERAGVDKSFNDLFSQFRKKELDRMQRIPLPEDWQGATEAVGAKLDSAVTYKIPSLADYVSAARDTFSQQLDQALGPSRAQLLEQAADSHLRENLDDLGTGDRMIAFLDAVEKDGSHSLWYGIADDRHGSGSFQRIPDNVDPNSQIAYYANLFGVKLPGK
jgi:hypothetical protein